MDQETLFTATKWDILSALAEGKKSPMELAEECQTSLANVSQQLRLLELGGIVVAQRVPNRAKGQPRVLYSLKGNQSYIISTMPGLVEKKSMTLASHQKATLAIWFNVDPSKQFFVERAFWNLEEKTSKMEGLYYDVNNLSAVHFVVVTKDEGLKKQLKEYSIENQGSKLQVKFTIKAEFTPTSKHIDLLGTNATPIGRRGRI